jgi:signal transduction histidine kinase
VGKTQGGMNRDSLMQSLSRAKEDTSKISLLLVIQKMYSLSNFDSSIHYLNQANDLAKKLNTDKFDYTINNKYSIYYYYNSNFDKALEHAFKAKDIAEKEKDLKLLARSYNNISGIYNHFGRPKNAIEYTLKCLDLAEQSNDSVNLSSFNVTASETYGALRQYDKVVVYAKKGIEYGKAFNNIGSVINALNNLSIGYSQLNKLDSAVDANIQQLELAKQQQNIVFINYALINLCYNNFRNGNTTAAAKYAEELKQYIKDYPDNQLSPEVNVAFALGLISQKKYDLAAAEIDKGLETATAGNNNISLVNLYNTYTLLNYLKGNIKEAELFTYKSDSVATKRNLEELNQYAQDLEAKYETEKKESQIKLQKAQLKQKNTLNYLFGGAALSVVLIGLFGYRNYRNKQKLQQTKIDELEKEKQLAATEAVLKGEEQERSRLAKDLHDGLGGMLSGIKHSLNTMKGNLIMTPDNAQSFERSIDMLDSSIKEMRRVAHNMMPETLVKFGLDVALKDFCNDINQSGALVVNYQSIGLENANIEQTTAITIYRVVQELLNNIMKHASAKNALVQVTKTNEDFSITVEDDGKGFDTGILKTAKGAGWSNLQSRIEYLKGKIDVQSAAGKGTSVLIELKA